MGHHRVLFVSAPFSGIEVFFRNLRPRVEAAGTIASSWVFVDWASAERAVAIPVIGSNWTVRCGYAARRAIRDFVNHGVNFDAAVFNHVTLPAFVGGFRRKIPTILSVDVTPTLLDGYSSWYKGKVRGLNPATRWLKSTLFDRGVYHDARKILAWSELSRRSLIEEYSVSPEQVEVVPPGIDVDAWCPSGRNNDSEARTGDRARILFVGADFERKGGDHLLALAAMPEFQKCEFDVVTKERVAGAPANVRFHTGVSANSARLLDLYQAADIFLLPTRADFTPNAICEAMAMELPVVSTQVGGIPEMVVAGETGFLTAVDDRDAIGQHLHALIRKPDLRQRMGKAGRERVVSSFNIVKSARTFLTITQQCASDGAA